MSLVFIFSFYDHVSLQMLSISLVETNIPYISLSFNTLDALMYVIKQIHIAQICSNLVRDNEFHTLVELKPALNEKLIHRNFDFNLNSILPMKDCYFPKKQL